MAALLIPLILLIVSYIWHKLAWAATVRKWGIGIFIAEIVLMGLFVLYFIFFPDLGDMYLERGCRRSLLELADIQDRYIGMESNDSYATWQDLKDEGLISQESTRGNFIDEYRITVFGIQKPDEISGEGAHGFLIIAYPDDPDPLMSAPLDIFAIDEDKIVHEWIGMWGAFTPDELDLQNEKLWKRVR